MLNTSLYILFYCYYLALKIAFLMPHRVKFVIPNASLVYPPSFLEPHSSSSSSTMDPTPPHPATTASPPASLAARPLIFVLSPPPARASGVDMYFYSPNANVMEGDYAALLTFAANYSCPLAIYQCPDMAAFLASNPTVTVRPFEEVPATVVARGHELMLS